MAVQVRVDLHHAQIRNFLYAPSGPVSRGVRRWAQEVRQVAMSNTPKATGQLASSSAVEMNTHPGLVVGAITFRARHALWVHEGTGIYGPRGRPIRARGRGLLKFPNRGGAIGPRGGRVRPYVYVRSTRGQPGQPFLTYALYLVMLPKGASIRTFRVR